MAYLLREEVGRPVSGKVLIKSDCIGETFTEGYPHPSYAEYFKTIFPQKGVVGVWNTEPGSAPVSKLVILNE